MDRQRFIELQGTAVKCPFSEMWVGVSQAMTTLAKKRYARS
jgi:hypothetical protein